MGDGLPCFDLRLREVTGLANVTFGGPDDEIEIVKGVHTLVQEIVEGTPLLATK